MDTRRVPEERIGAGMERLTVLIGIPGTNEWKSAIDRELRGVLEPYEGPWTVRLRDSASWLAGGGWSVEVMRPGHVWTLRIGPEDQDPTSIARHVADAVQPQRFKDGE